jgi:hypothetical protein
MVLLQEASFASQRLDHAQTLQFRVRLRDGVAVQPQLFRQRPDGRERLARLQRAGRSGSLNLIDKLEIDRLAGLEIDLKQQIGSPLS